MRCASSCENLIRALCGEKLAHARPIDRGYGCCASLPPASRFTRLWKLFILGEHMPPPVGRTGRSRDEQHARGREGVAVDFCGLVSGRLLSVVAGARGAAGRPGPPQTVQTATPAAAARENTLWWCASRFGAAWMCSLATGRRSTPPIPSRAISRCATTGTTPRSSSRSVSGPDALHLFAQSGGDGHLSADPGRWGLPLCHI